MYCNASGVLFSEKNLTCRLRSPSRYVRTIDVNFEVLRKVRELYVSYGK